ncbi:MULTISPECIES: hypothetical protein [Eubacterium]|uniref:hypothetical protein n=1 Tax=Eubacterium TaxID=1730 RepID=UPI00156A37BB|nr:MULTISPECIES: hypothetical protein [Eubacterium]MCR5367572.1 hypothetical protein [Eubacterium sp.]
MDVVDIKKLETSIIYLQRITEGKNPVNNMPADDDSVINNPNVIRCMEFIKETLEKLKQNDGYIGRKPRNIKSKYPLEALENFQYNGDKTITKFVEQINSFIDTSANCKISFRQITAWLKENGFLEDGNIEGRDRKCTIVTSKGKELGIMSEIREGINGQKYEYILYGKFAQVFIVSKLGEMI